MKMLLKNQVQIFMKKNNSKFEKVKKFINKEERKEIDELKEKISKLKRNINENKIEKNETSKKEIKSLRERINQIKK